MIDQATIDRIVDAAQIVDVVSDFVTLRKRGANYVGLCPFHDDKTPSFYVSPSKGICKCFACGKGGSPIHFIMEHEQVSFSEALRHLAKKYGIEIKEKELSNEEKTAQSERESALIVNQFARDYYHSTLLNHPEGRSVGMAYFRARGFRDDIIEKFQLGYALPQRDAFPKAARAKGFKDKYLATYEVRDTVSGEVTVRGSGICYKKDDGQLADRYAGRVIFPWISLSGKVVAFGGRLLDSRTKGVAQKYVNSPDTEIFHKDRELYGIYQAKKAIVKEDCVYMVEGYTDVISMHQCGIENVVANSGTALSLRQINLLHRLTNNITLLYDSDEAGIKAARRGAEMLLAEGMSVTVCLLPDGDDPDSFARKHSAGEYRDFIRQHATNYIRFKIAHLTKHAGSDPLKRTEVIKEAVSSIALIPEAIMRDAFVKEAADLLSLNEKQMVGYVAGQRKKNIEEENARRERERNAAALRAARAEEGAENKPAESVSAPREEREESPESHPAAQQTGGWAETARPSQPDDPLYKYERLIMQMVVRYGEREMCTFIDDDGSEQSLNVIGFVNSELQTDDLSLHNPVYRRMLEEAVAHVADFNFRAEPFFVNHPDMEISRQGVDLTSNRYQLSKYHAKCQNVVSDGERLAELVPTLTATYKYAIVNERLKECMRLLKDPSVTGDSGRCTDIMSQYSELRQIQSELAKKLGERVILG